MPERATLRRATITITIAALAAAAGVAVLAATGAHVAWVVLCAFAMSMLGSLAVVRALAVTVAPGELVVLIGGRHRGPDRQWRGWRIVHGGKTLRLPGEEVVRVPVTADRRAATADAIDAALFRRGTRGDVAAVVRAAASP